MGVLHCRGNGMSTALPIDEDGALTAMMEYNTASDRQARFGMTTKMARWAALGACCVLIGVCALPTGSLAATPGTLVVEGMLSSSGGGAAADGLYDITFSIYNVQTGGSAAWTEGTTKVAVKNGQFSHVLGNAKPLNATMLGKLNKGWLGLKIGPDPELPRQRLHSVAYAVMADTAAKLSCSGCVAGAHLKSGSVGANKVGFTFAGAKTKGGPANVAMDLQCTGCVTVAELKIDKDLDLGGNALKAKAVAAASVSATTFQGDGSKLTGIKIPSGECKVAGEVVKGINPDGTLKCVKAMDPKALPADGIDEISNYLLHNQFQNTDCIPKAVPIKDNNPVGVSSELTFGDYGLAQKLDVLIDVKNSDLKTVIIKLWDPNNVEYLLWDKSKAGNSLSGTWPSKTKVLKGDLTKWVGKNPKGKWRIQVIDGKFLNNGNDGAVNKFCINIQTLSNKKIKVQGDLWVTNKIQGNGDTVDIGTLRIDAGKGVCDAKHIGVLRGDPKKGLLSCDGKYWVSAMGQPPIFQGGCDNSHPGGNGTWWNRCLSRVSVNTGPEYWHLDSKSKTGSSNNAYGRLYIDRDGWYEVNTANYGHMRYMHHYIYVSNVAIGQIVTYNYTNHPRALAFSKVIYIKKGQYIQARVHGGGGTSHLWHQTKASLNGITYSGHNWLTVKYMGPKL